MKSAAETKEIQKTEEYRNGVTIHLVKICGDLAHIKEKVNENNKHLISVNGRVREAEKQISWIKGIGSMFVFALATILTWLGLDK